MIVSWVYRVVIDNKPDTPPEHYRSHIQDDGDSQWISPEERWPYYGTQQWARRRYLDLGAAHRVAIIHASNRVRCHIERAPIGPWEEM